MQQRQNRTGFISIILLILLLGTFFSYQQILAKNITKFEKTESDTLTKKNISIHVLDALEKSFPFQILTSNTKEDGVLILTAQITKENLEQLFQTHDLPLHNALYLLPNQVPATLKCQLDFRNKKSNINILRFEIAGFDLTKTVRTKLTDAINQTIDTAISSIHLPQ